MKNNKSLYDKFPSIPPKAIDEVINIICRTLHNNLSGRGIFRPKRVTVPGWGTFIVGGKVDEKRFVKRKYKVDQKAQKKAYYSKKYDTINGLL